MLAIFAEDHQQQPESTPALKQVQVGSFSFAIPETALEVVQSLQPRIDLVHWVSRAEWSAIDLLLAVLAQHPDEPAKIYLSSYAFSERPARILANLISEGRIAWIRCIIDSRVDVRSQTALQLIKGCADKLKMVDTHAKVTVVHVGDFFYTIVGSANYTSNKRFEAGIITTDGRVAAFHKKWIKDVLESDTGTAE